jgi:phage terminase small subunit
MDHPIRPLTEPEQHFFEHYCKTGDAKEAALRAGLTQDPERASYYASKMLKAPHIQAALTQAAQEQVSAMEVTAERILREYAAIAFSDINDFVQADDSPGSDRTFRIRDPDKVEPFKRAAVKKYTERSTPTGLESTVEMHSKMTALNQLSKFFGLDKGNLPSAANESSQKSGESESAAEAQRLYQAMMKGA